MHLDHCTRLIVSLFALISLGLHTLLLRMSLLLIEGTSSDISTEGTRSERLHALSNVTNFKGKLFMSEVAKIAELFTESAPQYTAITEAVEYFCPKWIAQNVHQFENLRELRVLDLACGSGLNVKALSQERAGIRAEGVDVASGMLSIARATGLYEKLYNCDLNTRLSEIPSETFDLVMVFGVLLFLNDVPLCMSECSRVLKPGGTLWATFRAFEEDDMGSPPRHLRQGGLMINGYSAAEILHTMRRSALGLTALDLVVEHTSPTGFPVMCYLLQAHKSTFLHKAQSPLSPVPQRIGSRPSSVAPQ